MTSVGIWPFERKVCLKFVDESETILKHVFVKERALFTPRHATYG